MERYLGDRTAGEYRAHMTAIKTITDAWHNGEIAVEAKRKAIAAENARFYDGQLGAAGACLTSEPRIYDDIAFVISDATGQPLPVVRHILARRRQENAVSAA